MIRKAAGILIKSKDKYLIGHATNYSDQDWTITKGLVDKGESDYDAAVREANEEFGLNLIALGCPPDTKPYKVIKYESLGSPKVLVVFLVNDEEGVLQHESLSCNSFTYDGDPEIDGFKWVTAEQAKHMVKDYQRSLFT